LLLNVGHISALSINRSIQGTVDVRVDEASFDSTTAAKLPTSAKIISPKGAQEHLAVPNRKLVRLPLNEPQLPAALEVLRQSLFSFIDKAVAAVKSPTWDIHEAYSPGVLVYLR